MKYFFLFFLFSPFSLAYSASSQSTEVKDYCPNAEEGSFQVQVNSYKNLLAVLERNDKKNRKTRRRRESKGTGQR